MLQQSSIKFLKALPANNNKPWFDEHRNEFINTKTDFENLVNTLISEFNSPFLFPINASEFCL